MTTTTGNPPTMDAVDQLIESVEYLGKYFGYLGEMHNVIKLAKVCRELKGSFESLRGNDIGRYCGPSTKLAIGTLTRANAIAEGKDGG